MIRSRDERTRKFLERLRKRDQKDREMRTRAKADSFPMRLASVKHHRDGSVTKIWRAD